MEIQIQTSADIENAARIFSEEIGQNKIFAFYGDMGVGKTTFIRALCHVLGVSDTINSPTFSIVNEYTLSANKPIYHFDFYRLNNISEALDFGVEEYFDSGSICFIEWPEKIENLLPSDVVKVNIKEGDRGMRIVKI